MKLQSIIDSTIRLKSCKFCKETPIEPIANFQNYYESKVRIEGGESDRLRKLREYHDALPVQVPPKINKGYTYPHDFEHVSVHCHVTKSGNVKITMCLPFLEQYKKYHSHGNNVPVNDKVRLMKLAGYPEDILKKIVKNDYTNTKNSEKNKIFLEKIFGSK